MWTTDKARAIYSLEHWGGGYFDVNDKGHLVARPQRGPETPTVDLFELARECRAQGLTLPVLVRFTDILRDRVDTLTGAFVRALTTGCDAHGLDNRSQPGGRRSLRRRIPLPSLEALDTDAFEALLARR